MLNITYYIYVMILLPFNNPFFHHFRSHCVRDRDMIFYDGNQHIISEIIEQKSIYKKISTNKKQKTKNI